MRALPPSGALMITGSAGGADAGQVNFAQRIGPRGRCCHTKVDDP
jgi:hypothetical protein